MEASAASPEGIIVSSPSHSDGHGVEAFEPMTMVMGNNELSSTPGSATRFDVYSHLKKAFQDLQPEGAADHALNQLSYKNFPALQQALEKLTLQSKNKTLDIVFCTRITSMFGTLNLYLDPFMWHEASALVAKSLGHGVRFACTLWG